MNSENSPLAKMKIRKMEFKDLQKVFELGEKLFTADEFPTLYRTWDEYEVLGHFISEGELCIVAEINKEICGFAIGTTITKRKSRWMYGYLLWIGVSPEYKSKGLGQKLLNKISKLMIKAGATMLLADTSKNNKPAIEFFKKNGFDKQKDHVYLFKNINN